MKANRWLISWTLIVLFFFSIVSFLVYNIDPLFHYHKPHTDKYFYTINSQREQNDGISKHFEYDGIITGTSMTENFIPSEAEDLYGGHFIKIPYSGASYKEINDNLSQALKYNPKVKTIIRSLDMTHFNMNANYMRTDLGNYPYYLYDENPFNDIEYLLNRSNLELVCNMVAESKKDDFVPGITSFDYSYSSNASFGINTIIPESNNFHNIDPDNVFNNHLSDEERKVIYENITKNVTDLADKYPDVNFYYFYPPYSILYWYSLYENGNLGKQFEMLDYVTELVLPHKNIFLFSFNNRIDIISDLNNYRNSTHYGEWINSLMLNLMAKNECQLTNTNYINRLQIEHNAIIDFDYTLLNNQKDYEYDFFAAALLNQEITGNSPIELFEYNNIEFISDTDNRTFDKTTRTNFLNLPAINIPQDIDSIGAYIYTNQNKVYTVKLNLSSTYNYLVFDGQALHDNCYPVVYIYDDYGNIIRSLDALNTAYGERINYVLDLGDMQGNITILFGSILLDNNSFADAQFQFSNIYLY